MARFEVRTPVIGYNGLSVSGVVFTNGAAVVTSDTDDGLRALAYFKGAGYGILALDEHGIDDVLAAANASPEAEAARLRAEIRGLKDRQQLDELRAERDKLRADVFGTEPEAPAGEGATFTPGAGAAEPAIPSAAGGASEQQLLAPPAESAPVAEWRAWAVASGRASEEDVAKAPRAEVIATYGTAYDRDRDEQLKGGASA